MERKDIAMIYDQLPVSCVKQGLDLLLLLLLGTRQTLCSKQDQRRRTLPWSEFTSLSEQEP